MAPTNPSWVDRDNPYYIELKKLDASLVELVEKRNSAALLLEELPKRYPANDIADNVRAQQAWEYVGRLHQTHKRIREALEIFWQLYQQILLAQKNGKRVHKGTPLVWMSDCFTELGCPVLSKRYLMLTLVEDAIEGKGVVSPQDTGVYFRLAWGPGLPDNELNRYATTFYTLAQQMPLDALFPEALLQHVDDRWLTELPSPNEALSYRVNPHYVSHLLARLGDGTGKALEVLAQYLMSCMPGCRTALRARSRSTDYDVVCTMEGFEVDFRSELGRYFVCECKDWETAADYTAMAKFCRLLDSTKSRFGVLFSKKGISGAGNATNAEGEQLKVFQDRGMVIVVLTLRDLELVAQGANLIHLLRERYEAVRLDLRASRAVE